MRTVQEFGRIDGLVNNAGILVRQPAEELTAEDWDLLFDINVKGTFLGSQTVLPAMKKGPVEVSLPGGGQGR